MGKEIVTKEFNFMEDTIVAVDQNDVWYISPRHICENVGLDWASQSRKIEKESEKFNRCLMTTVGHDGKLREMVMIPVTRINTWILSINAKRVKNLRVRAYLRKYQDQLSDWLYEVGFLGAAVNKDALLLPAERQVEVLGDALHRARLQSEPLNEYQEKIATILGLPDLEGVDNYKTQRLQMLTDVKLGVASPLFSKGLRGVVRLTDELFYIAYMIERWCVDKLICCFPQDLPTPVAIEQYIRDKGYCEPWVVKPIRHADARRVVKLNTLFSYSISDLIIRFNKPAELIHNAMFRVVKDMEDVFTATEVKLELPAIRDRASMSARREQYMKTAEWWDKRNAFFKVFNCCVVCGDMEVASSRFEAHHLHYDTLGFESPWDLVPLCKDCHTKVEGRSR